MRARSLLAILSLLLLGCASLRPASVAPGASAAGDLSGVLSLIGERDLAQACPISPTEALTNSHVVARETILGYEIIPFVWESGGRIGLLGSPLTTTTDRFRDLARVVAHNSTFPHWYPIAQDAPKPGDKVRFRGFDFRKRKDAFTPRDFEATVLRIRNAHLVYFPAGVRGTSGSCVLNDRGEVVAINSFGKDTEDASAVGGGVGIWGSLLELGK